MKKSILRASSALRAVALLGAGTTAFIAAAPAAAQQDYTRGAIEGRVINEAGQPLAGAAVTLRSNEQGFTRTATSGADGRFQFNQLPTGSYTVNIRGAGGEVVNDPAVSVVAGKSTNFEYTAVAGNTATVDGQATPENTAGGGDGAVVVVGRRRATNDLGSTTTGLSIDVARLVENVPVQRTQSGLILLAPGTNQGDAQFADCADCVSFGGATIAENSYFVNGLNTTNFRTMVGNSLVPFEFYRTFDVRTGGWTAEFGRALGGVTSAVTKSGSNNFEAGAVISYNPDFLQSDAPNTFTCEADVGEVCPALAPGDNANGAAVGRYKQLNERDFRENITGNFYASGPIIRDRLFFYGLFSPRYNRQDDTSVAGGFRFKSKSDTPFYGLKLDAIPIDGHRLEGTFWSDDRTIYTDYLPIDPVTGDVTGASIGREKNRIGGKNWIGQYTGQFTDFFTLSVLHGRNNYRRLDIVGGSEVPIIQSTYGGALRTVSGSGVPLAPTAGKDRRIVNRIDADIYANFFGRHHFRFGVDQEKLESLENTFYTGGRIYQFQPGDADDAARIRTRTYINQGGFESKQRAYYIQDSWDLFNERLNLNLGLRNDNYENKGITGKTFIKMKNQWAPRLGASFDVFGDKNTKINAFFGKYYLGVPTNTNIRLGGAEVFYEQYFNLAPGVGPGAGANFIPTGQQFDSSGAPVLGSIVTEGEFAAGPDCPAFGPGAGQQCFQIFSEGIPGPTDTLVAEDLKPMFQNEFIFGASHRMDDWTFSARHIRRNLKTTLEDIAIDGAVLDYCDAEGIEGCEDVFYGFHQYVLANPGEDLTVRLDGDCDVDPRQCEVATLTAEQLGYPKPTRKYRAFEFQVNKAFNGTYGLDFSYTWQKVRGNYEGSVKSDNNQDDAGLTQDFDQPGLADGANGILANERKHTFKFFGSYKPVDWLTLGTNITVQSPRNFSCIGRHPTDPLAGAYGAASFWSFNPKCADKGVETATGPGGRQYALIPRGTAFKGEWLRNVDLGAQFQLPGALNRSSFRVDVFNLFNWKQKIDFYEFGETAGRALQRDYGLVTGYQAPRSVRFTLALRYGGGAR